MRKLVTLRKVTKLTPIEGADVIELAHVDGWQCVVKKGEFQEGDWGIYFEIDSMIPHKNWNDHLFKNQKDIDKGFLRIKTIRLRGQLSQGLMLPVNLLLESDLTEAVGVHKYDPPIPEEMTAKGNFPSFIQKTDEERVQNLVEKVKDWLLHTPVYVTEKLEGSSITIYCRMNEVGDWDLGVCSRNLELKLNVVNDDGVELPSENKFVTTVRNLNIFDKMREWCEKSGKDLVLQGELIGVGIQGNIYGLHGIDIAFYTAQDGKHGRLDIFEIAKELDIKTVPILRHNEYISSNMDELLLSAEGKSVLNNEQEREGIVIRAMDNSFSFKVISNKYLLKQKD